MRTAIATLLRNAWRSFRDAVTEAGMPWTPVSSDLYESPCMRKPAPDYSHLYAERVERERARLGLAPLRDTVRS